MPMRIDVKARVITTIMKFIMLIIAMLVMSNMSKLMNMEMTMISEY